MKANPPPLKEHFPHLRNLSAGVGVYQRASQQENRGPGLRTKRSLPQSSKTKQTNRVRLQRLSVCTGVCTGGQRPDLKDEVRGRDHLFQTLVSSFIAFPPSLTAGTEPLTTVSYGRRIVSINIPHTSYSRM